MARFRPFKTRRFLRAHLLCLACHLDINEFPWEPIDRYERIVQAEVEERLLIATAELGEGFGAFRP